MNEQTVDRTNSAGEQEQQPQQTDNGPKPGDGEVPDQDAVSVPPVGDPSHEGADWASLVLSRALSFRGTVEQPPGSNRQPFGARYGWNGVAWCNIFVSQVGFEVKGSYSLLGRFASTIACAKWWQEQGRFGSSPRVGAAVFFDWSGSRSLDAIDHIGLVVEPLASGLVRTIEGNASIPGRPDGVWAHDRNPRNIVGYGYPAYLASGGEGRAPVSHDPGDRILREGSTGADVRVLQGAVGVPADGEFGRQTKAALIRFQRAHGLTADGEAGRRTWTEILRLRGAGGQPAGPGQRTPAAKAKSPAPKAKSAVPSFPGLLGRGSRGAGVVALQKRLLARGWRRITVDGDFGPATEGVVRAFQKEKGLTVDGRVGPRTWAALWSSPVT